MTGESTVFRADTLQKSEKVQEERKEKSQYVDTKVKEIRKTGIYENVFCIQEPETHTMTLDSGIITGQCVRICKW